MDIITNDRLVRRNDRIGKFTSLAGLIVLGGGMYISFAKPELFSWSLSALLLGFALSQIGIFFGNRWSRRPRPDELLNAALKGLDTRYRLYHYTTPASHLLVGPAGIWVLLPRHQRGVITYERGRWHNRGGGFMQAYLRIFAQEGLGRPELEANAEVESVAKRLKKFMDEGEIPLIQAALVFTHEGADIQVHDSPMPALTIKKLKDFMRKEAKSKPISMPKVKAVQDVFSGMGGTVKTEESESE